MGIIEKSFTEILSMTVCSIYHCNICVKVVRKMANMQFTETCRKLLQAKNCCSRFGATGSMVPSHGSAEPATGNVILGQSVLYITGVCVYSVILAWVFMLVWALIQRCTARNRRLCNDKSTKVRYENCPDNSAKNENSKTDKITRRSLSSRALISPN